MKKNILLFVIIISTVAVNAVDYTSTGNGDWNSPIWDVAGYPDSNGDDILDITDNITLPTGVTLIVGDLNVGTNKTLTIDGDLTVNNFIINNSFTLVVNGSFTVLNDVIMNNNSDFDINIDGNVLVEGDFTFTGNGDVGLAGSMVVSGTITGTSNNIFTGTGNLTAGNIVGVNTGGVSGTVVNLPIELSYFKAASNGIGITINWETATEKNNDYFTIERSTDGIYFEEIATSNGAGNSSEPLNYTHTDNSPLFGVSYYRLMQTDYDGAFEVFSVVSVAHKNQSEFKVGPNPTSGTLDIKLGGEIEQGTIEIYNLIGVLVKHAELTSYASTIDISELQVGNYMLIINANNIQISKFISKK